MTKVQRQPKTSELIFPYHPRSVTAGFQRVRNALGIEDCVIMTCGVREPGACLRQDLSIEEVAQVTGHRSLTFHPYLSEPAPLYLPDSGMYNIRWTLNYEIYFYLAFSICLLVKPRLIALYTDTGSKWPNIYNIGNILNKMI